MSEFFQQINFDGNELFARPDTLSYIIAFKYHFLHCQDVKNLKPPVHLQGVNQSSWSKLKPDLDLAYTIKYFSTWG